MIHQATIVISIGYGGVESHVTLEAFYTYVPLLRGRREALGVPVEPDEPASVDLIALSLGGLPVLHMIPEAVLREIEQGLVDRHAD